ncbi:extracellular solute-binding protein [Paenibacillus sp. IB182496]|uniref:Extracellular solute-binding protein n=2 Tax=Paenibacillus sabuli TaxID=2772509 RepID=A0A927BUK3_9BACL|nr:extracellular solute-binding protein [Paenibacillus sabuli]
MASLLVLTMIVVAACGGNNNGGGTNGGNSGGAGGEEQVTLTLSHPWTSPNPDNDVYKARIAAFEEANPNIKIEQDAVAAAQYKTKLFTLATANNLADINVVWPGADLDPLTSGDLLLPLNDYMDNWDGLVREGSLTGYNVDGNQFAIPTKQNYVDIVYYNKELLAQVGYDTFPETYADFIDMVKKLKEAGITPISLGNKEKWPLQSSYISVLAQRFGGADFLEKVVAGEAKFTDPEFVSAVGVIDELTKLEAFNVDANNMDSVQAQDYLIQGKAAMHISSATVDARIRTNNEEGDKFGIALFPSVEGGKGEAGIAAGVSQFGIAISSQLDEAKQEAALKFLEFFVSEDLYQDLTAAGILVPADIEPNSDINPYLQEMMELTSKGSTPVFDAVVPTAAAKELENGLQAITIGRSTPEEVAASTQDELGN